MNARRCPLRASSNQSMDWTCAVMIARWCAGATPASAASATPGPWTRSPGAWADRCHPLRELTHPRSDGVDFCARLLHLGGRLHPELPAQPIAPKGQHHARRCRHFCHLGAAAAGVDLQLSVLCTCLSTTVRACGKPSAPTAASTGVRHSWCRSFAARCNSVQMRRRMSVSVRSGVLKGVCLA